MAFHGQYVVEAKLGEGGMEVVYRVRDNETGECVALKTLHQVSPRTLVRFKEEFRALSEVSQPNVVELYDLFGANDGVWFFTMELLEEIGFYECVTEEGRTTFSG